MNSPAMLSGAANTAVVQPLTQRIVDGVSTFNDRLADSVLRLEQLADKIFGPEPQNAKGPETSPSPGTVRAAILQGFEHQDNLLARLNAVTRRLNDI